MVQNLSGFEITVSVMGRITFHVKDKSAGVQADKQDWLGVVNRAVTTVSPLYGRPLTIKTAIICKTIININHQLPPTVKSIK